MARLLYDIEDYLEDAAEAGCLPHWLRRALFSIGRAAGDLGAVLSRHSTV